MGSGSLFIDWPIPQPRTTALRAEWPVGPNVGKNLQSSASLASVKACLSLWVGLPLQGVWPPQQVQTCAAVSCGSSAVGGGRGTYSVDSTARVVDAYALWLRAP